MSQLAEALHVVGIQSTTERLRDIAQQALIENPRSWDGAKDAVFLAVRDDAGLLWTLFESHRAFVVEKLLREVAVEMRTAQADGGQQVRERQAPYAPIGQTNARATVHAGGGQGGSVDHKIYAHSRSRVGMAAVSNVAKLSLLDTFKINGRPIGDCTAREAGGWASSRERDARFVRLLTANLPPDRPIREFRRAAEVDQLYVQAQEATNAA